MAINNQLHWCVCSALCTGVCVVVKRMDSGTTAMTVRVLAAMSNTHAHKLTNQNNQLHPLTTIKWTSQWTPGALFTLLQSLTLSFIAQLSEQRNTLVQNCLYDLGRPHPNPLTMSLSDLSLNFPFILSFVCFFAHPHPSILYLLNPNPFFQDRKLCIYLFIFTPTCCLFHPKMLSSFFIYCFL